ncbi:MAG: plastocyanin/azurin family copper-binding protein [Halobacteriales archaeon]|nr:plastocyanin/azurin family copper-binding protein [Halobacteriales archaeon]
MRRRRFLRAGAAAAALGLAGCTGDGGDEPTSTATSAPDTQRSTPTDGEATMSPTDVHTATSTPMDGGTPTAETDAPTETPTRTPTATPRPSVDQEVEVGPGSLSFEPSSFELPAGGTVRWVWQSGGHNVKPSATPDGSDWAGTPGGEFATFDAGHTYTVTFEVAGSYEYYCAPHRSSGMTGSFTVG